MCAVANPAKWLGHLSVEKALKNTVICKLDNCHLPYHIYSDEVRDGPCRSVKCRISRRVLEHVSVVALGVHFSSKRATSLYPKARRLQTQVGCSSSGTEHVAGRHQWSSGKHSVHACASTAARGASGTWRGPARLCDHGRYNARISCIATAQHCLAAVKL